MMNKLDSIHAAPQSTIATVLIGFLAAFGITVSGAVLALAVAGFLQCKVHLSDLLDDGIPLLILAGGMLIAGRIAVDLAGRAGTLCALGAAVLIGAIGMEISITTEAHGDAVNPSKRGMPPYSSS